MPDSLLKNNPRLQSLKNIITLLMVWLVFHISNIPVYKLYMSEWEVTHFAVQFSFPLTIYGHFGNFDNVTNLEL